MGRVAPGWNVIVFTAQSRRGHEFRAVFSRQPDPGHHGLAERGHGMRGDMDDLGGACEPRIGCFGCPATVQDAGSG